MCGTNASVFLVSRGESVGMDATQMNSGIKWQQHSLSSGSHVSWRDSKKFVSKHSDFELG